MYENFPWNLLQCCCWNKEQCCLSRLSIDLNSASIPGNCQTSLEIFAPTYSTETLKGEYISHYYYYLFKPTFAIILTSMLVANIKLLLMFGLISNNVEKDKVRYKKKRRKHRHSIPFNLNFESALRSFLIFITLSLLINIWLIFNLLQQHLTDTCMN